MSGAGRPPNGYQDEKSPTGKPVRHGVCNQRNKQGSLLAIQRLSPITTGCLAHLLLLTILELLKGLLMAQAVPPHLKQR